MFKKVMHIITSYFDLKRQEIGDYIEKSIFVCILSLDFLYAKESYLVYIFCVTPRNPNIYVCSIIFIFEVIHNILTSLSLYIYRCVLIYKLKIII